MPSNTLKNDQNISSVPISVAVMADIARQDMSEAPTADKLFTRCTTKMI